jgi:AraC-like DNA-binding protein
MNAKDFVSSYMDAWNRRDSAAVADHLAERCNYFDIAIHQNMSRAELISYLDEHLEEETHYYEITGEVLVGEHTLSFQYKALPRDTSAEASPESIWYGAEFITLQNGTAVEITDYYEPNNNARPVSPLARNASTGHVKRYAKSGLSAEQMATVQEHLALYMCEQRAFLDCDLTLPDLANALSCSVNHISQAINAGFGMNFFDYINELRVREAMHLLTADDSNDSNDRTVLSIALEVGFNSTSTFYVAFKKVTQQTPAQYRRANKNNPALAMSLPR